MDSTVNEFDKSSFFKNHKYNFIGVDFQFDKLVDFTSKNFVKELKSNLNVAHYIKRMHVHFCEGSAMFLDFYAEDIEQKRYQIIKCYFSTTHREYYTINSFNSAELSNLGLKLLKEEV